MLFKHTTLAIATSLACYIPIAQAAEALPTLDVQYDCGDCQPTEKIKALIAGAYMDAADKQKRQLDEALPPLPLTITSYRSRGKARLLLDILAGADHITGKLQCKDQSYEVSDIAITVINGIESVAENIGRLAYQKVESCYASVPTEVPNTAAPITPAPNTAPIPNTEAVTQPLEVQSSTPTIETKGE